VCGSVLYRLARTSGYVDWDAGTFTNRAFERREDEKGLSAYVAARCTVEEAFRDTGFNKYYGHATVLAGHAWDLELKIVAVSDIEVEIIGMPTPIEDRERAVNIASRLAERARTIAVHRPPLKRELPS
jgi:hypothetical protein